MTESSMPGAEILVLAILAAIAVAVFALLRRERLATERGEPSTTHPFVIGLYRGCAAVIVAFLAVAVVAMIMTAASSRG
jgi:hypothetical protein